MFFLLRSHIVEGGEKVTEFEQIYRDYFNDVFLYILRLSGNRDIAEEITSETFFKAMRSVGAFRGDCDIRVWLCQIAKNCYYTYLKKARRTTSTDIADLPEMPSGVENAEEALIRREDASRIQEILHSIREPYKEVFMWRVFAELSFKQIAQIFGKSENWACVTYHRAKAMIKTRLEDIDRQ